MSEIRRHGTGRHGIGRRHFLYGAAAVAAGVMGDTGCTPDDTRGSGGRDGVPVVAVDAQRRSFTVSPFMTGVNGAKWYDDAYGMWDSEHNRPAPGIVEKIKKAGVGMIRYPGGTSANLFNWRVAVGPQGSRGRQIEGKQGATVDSRFGPDEYMAFIREVGATPQIMAPFAGSAPDEIADWVAYMNAPQGTTWGDLRARNGHPEPYGVRYWEIGNELHGENQRYWMSADDDKAMRQYAFGGTQRQKRQHVGTPTDHRPSAAVSNGQPHQSFTVWYPPVVPKSQTIRVGDTTWREVADLASAGADDPVYTFDPRSGGIRFGDGRHGKIPQQGAKITADYDSGPHAGFVDYYTKMKAVDPSIDVLAIWAPIEAGKLVEGQSFPEFLAEHGHADKYDGMAIHPYTNFPRDLKVTSFPDKRAGHDYQMLGDAAAATMVSDLTAQVRKHGKDDAYIAVSECGALFFGGEREADAYPEYSYAMSHALYMASQWARFADLGVRWTASNDLIGEKPGLSRTLFGGAPSFVATPDAIVREQVSDFFHGGGHVVASEVKDNAEVSTRETPLGSSYEALVTHATVDKDGTLNLLVVNRSPDDDIKSRVEPVGFRHATTVDVSVVAGRTYHDFNNAEHPDAVTIERSRVTAHGTSLTCTFPAHSVTLLRFPPEEAGATSSDEKRTSHA
ncbi:alpha-L-arabinofuranosidase C-terminal domain-containing protein [Streptomyces sp. CY1]|uniref:alpha-L-arabinofuranosidase C-terminal domain-containing protein n=1 Tax=Streptomyces sp. CY1 TaxID=3388313 RepID=UPI00399F4B2D